PARVRQLARLPKSFLPYTWGDPASQSGDGGFFRNTPVSSFNPYLRHLGTVTAELLAVANSLRLSRQLGIVFSTEAPPVHSSRTMPNGEKRGLSCICSHARGFHPSYGLRRGYQNGLAGTLICTGKPGSKSHEVLCVIASWV